MRLYTFEVNGTRRIGAEQNGQIVDLVVAYSLLASRRGPQPEALRALPPDLMTFIRLGPPAMAAARDTLEFMKKRPAAPVGEQLAYPPELVKVLAPLSRPGKILLSDGPPADSVGPEIFVKFASTIIGPGDPIIQPRDLSMLHARPYLCATLAQRLRHADEKTSLGAIFGCTILNDISAPEIKTQSILTRNRDTFTPLGPSLVTTDEHNALPLQQLLQRLAEFLASLSTMLSLEPGDLVGVPLVAEHAQLRVGDRTRAGVDPVGYLENRVISAE
jgi:acylpyruvate hydrolase